MKVLQDLQIKGSMVLVPVFEQTNQFYSSPTLRLETLYCPLDQMWTFTLMWFK